MNELFSHRPFATSLALRFIHMDGDGWAAAAGAGGPTMKEAVAWPRQTAKRLRCGGCERGERGREGGREGRGGYMDRLLKCLSVVW